MKRANALFYWAYKFHIVNNIDNMEFTRYVSQTR